MKVMMRRAVHLVLGALVVLASCVVVLVALGPRTGAYRTLTVLSASMRPTYGPGSVVLVRPTAPSDLRVGDVITYPIPVEDRRVVTHRIVEVVEAGPSPVLRTQGDANNAPDPWLTRLEGGVAWRVGGSLPWLGYGISALRDPLLSRALVWLCPFLWCVLWLIGLWRDSDGAAAPALASEERQPDSVLPPVRAWSPQDALARHQPSVDTLLLLASSTDRVLRWTDEVMSGRRWLRRQASRA